MGSSGKQRTTWAKLNRESKRRDKRADKEARKVARKLSAAGNGPTPEADGEELGTTQIDTDTAMSDDASQTPAQTRSSHSTEPEPPLA